MAVLIMLLGAAAIVAGCAFIFWPAALIAGGSLAVLAGWDLAQPDVSS